MEGEGLAHRVGKHWLLTLRAEKKLLPASVINQFTKTVPPSSKKSRASDPAASR